MALLRRRPTAWAEIAAALDAGRSPEELLDERPAPGESGQMSLIGGDPGDLAAAAGEELRRWAATGIGVLTLLDRAYPTNLRAAHDRPPLVFLRGELRTGDAAGVAVIGSRRASPAGSERAAAIARHLIGSGLPVISGLAAGIDAAAHRAALEAGGRTLAVVGTGLEHTYPPENAGLAHEIAAHGAVLSQFWPDTPPSRRTFPLRNAVMAGMAAATVIVEASARSGVRIQARRSLAQGRPVFLDASLLAQDWPRELAQRPAVHTFEDPAEVTAALARLDPSTPLVA